MGVYKNVGGRIHYFKTAADLAAFLKGETKAETTEIKVEQKQTKKKKKK